MPKQFDGNKTKTAIYVDDNKYEMSLKDGNYVAEIKNTAFEDTHISKIEFTDGSMIRNESVDWYLSPADDFFRIYMQICPEHGRTNMMDMIWKVM